MSPAEAKSRLIELGERGSRVPALFRSRIFQAAMLLGAAVMVRRLAGGRGVDRRSRSLLRLIARAGWTCAPSLIEQLAAGFGSFARPSEPRAPRPTR